MDAKSTSAIAAASDLLPTAEEMGLDGATVEVTGEQVIHTYITAEGGRVTVTWDVVD